ncbi:hypothetical protein AB5I41_30150 [Sphingomonas sp. MMS24-JH45]
MQTPGSAPARGPDAPRAAADAPAATQDPQGDAPIVPDAEFDAALPPISADINAPLEPMPVQPATTAPTAAERAAAVPITEGALPAVATTDPALSQPLEPLGSFSTVPLRPSPTRPVRTRPTSATPARSAGSTRSA